MRSGYSGSKGLLIRHKYRSKAGYTILEVLISVAIFSAMVTLATMALDQGLKQYHNLMETGLNFWGYAKHLWLHKSANSAVDYYVSSRDKGWYPYFKGNQDYISYVSLAPLAGDKPVVVWIRNERLDDGSRTLQYYELPVYGMDARDIERLYTFGDFRKGVSIPLLKGVQDVAIRFYGYDLLENRWIWTTNFDGAQKKLLPQVITIEYREKESAAKAKLTLGMSTNSRIKMGYNENIPLE